MRSAFSADLSFTLLLPIPQPRIHLTTDHGHNRSGPPTTPFMTHLLGLRLGGAVKARKLLLNDRQTYRVTDCACHREAYNRGPGEHLRTARAATPESIIVVIATPDCNCNPWFRNIT